MPRKIVPAISEIPYARYLGYILILYFLGFLGLNFLRLWGFGFSMEDVGIFRQVIWNTANGDWFQTSMKQPFEANGHWLGFHFDPLPILLAVPFYKIFPYAETLEVIHVALVTVTTVIVYKTCLELKLKNSTAFFWSIIYLFHPVTLYHAMFSFQEISFSTPMIALGIYFVIARNFRALVIICLLLLLTKENYGLTVFGFGMLWGWYNKAWKQAAILSLIGIIGLYLVVFVIMPELSPYGEHFMLSSTSDQVDYGRYQWLKQPFMEVLKAAPDIVFSQESVGLVNGLLLTVLFLPLLAIAFLLPMAGDLSVIVLSDSTLMKSVNYYYSASLIVPLIIAAAYSLKKISKKKELVRKTLLIGILIVNFILGSSAIATLMIKLDLFANSSMDWTIGQSYQQAVNLIPKDKILLVDQPTGTYITDRRNIMRFAPSNLGKADYVLFRISPYNFSPINAVENQTALWYAPILADSTNWGLIYWKYPYAVFKKNAGSSVDKKAMFEEIEFYQVRNRLPSQL